MIRVDHQESRQSGRSRMDFSDLSQAKLETGLDWQQWSHEFYGGEGGVVRCSEVFHLC